MKENGIKLPERAETLHKEIRHTTYLDRRLTQIAREQLNLGRVKDWILWDEVFRRGIESLMQEKAEAAQKASAN